MLTSHQQKRMGAAIHVDKGSVESKEVHLGTFKVGLPKGQQADRRTEASSHELSISIFAGNRLRFCLGERHTNRAGLAIPGYLNRHFPPSYFVAFRCNKQRIQAS